MNEVGVRNGGEGLEVVPKSFLEMDELKSSANSPSNIGQEAGNFEAK